MDMRGYGQPKRKNAIADMLMQAGGGMGPMVAQQSADPEGPFSQEEMERAARERGYDSYEQMIEYMKRRIPPPRRPKGTAQPKKNFFQRLLNDPGQALSDAFSWHPAKTLGKTAKELDKANRRNQR